MSSQDKKTIVVSEETHNIVKMVANMEKKTIEELTEEIFLSAIEEKVKALKNKKEELEKEND